MKPLNAYKKSLIDNKIERFCQSCTELLARIHDRQKKRHFVKGKQKGKRRQIENNV